jgi:hypothetical protein
VKSTYLRFVTLQEASRNPRGMLVYFMPKTLRGEIVVGACLNVEGFMDSAVYIG